MFGYDVYEAIKNYDKDVLILHGDRDSLVPISYSEQTVEVLPSAELQILSGEEHIYSRNAVQLVINAFSEFLYNHVIDI